MKRKKRNEMFCNQFTHYTGSFMGSFKVAVKFSFLQTFPCNFWNASYHHVNLVLRKPFFAMS